MTVVIEQEPLYDAKTFAKGKFTLLTWISPTDVQIARLAGKPLVQALRQITTKEEMAFALLQQQSANLWAQLVESAYKANPLSRWHRPQWIIGSPRAREFKDLSLQIAARLNATGRDGDGSFTFGDFNMGSGTMAVDEVGRMRLKTGDRFKAKSPLTGQVEELTLGAVIYTQQMGSSYQLLRPVAASTQAEIYQHYAQT